MLIWSQLIVPDSDPTTDPDAMNSAETFLGGIDLSCGCKFLAVFAVILAENVPSGVLVATPVPDILLPDSAFFRVGA